MKNVLFLIITLFSFPVFSQKIVIDSISQKAIPFIEIYSSKGEILGSTNYKGEIPPNILDRINREKIKQIYFNHNNFQNRYITTDELLKLKNVYLIPFQYNAVNNLKEVLVNSGKKYKYTKSTVYFRSIQFNNENPQYYMDGIADYYTDNKNGRTTIYILQNRSLQDTKIKQIDQEGAIRLNFNIAGPGDLSNFLNYKKFIVPYQVADYDDSIVISKENEEVGKITLEKDRLSLNLEIYSEKKPKVMKLFGSESILKNYSINSVYNNSDRGNPFQNLSYFKEYREYNIKQKKADQYTHINTIHEVYIIDNELTDFKPETHKNYYYNFLSNSNYSNVFWNNISSDYIKPISKTVENFIEKNLSEH